MILQSTSPYSRVTILVICCLFTAQRNFAQQITMSSMGVIDKTSSVSSTINFKSNTNCIDVQSGIMVLNGNKGNGEFAVNCIVNQQFNTLGVKLFPNPVKKIATIKFTSTPPLTETFNIGIWNAEGAFTKGMSASGYQIFQGLLFDFSNIAPGGYILKIESPHYIEAIKFIKAN
jgi:hypothetical protein